VYNNARGVTVETVISGLELIMKHIIPSKRIPMRNRPVLSVFHNKFIKFWSHSISVSIMACHAVGTSSILVETAKILHLA